ncbi:hypothetical protein [Streptomyces beijiangensis]|uniref:Uncharacterized protein n=1 Tax=Streptomyces beijiangensis TaxID=163361 RepID=A0A939FAM7_9ACTN|nr:hypothetical protein [Streptomyces beijiangensis]MBO0514784.1 hypothetical protein [Streptomyces beijiangensis]
MSTTTSIEPPVGAVARDAHWAAKMARLRSRKLPERTVSFVDDQQLKLDRNEAALHLAGVRARAQGNADSEGVPESERDAWVEARTEVLAADLALGAAQAALDDGTIQLMFRALPRPVWEALLREHPPTEEQADQGQEYNADSFPAALISASSVDGMSVEDAQELLDTWADSEAKVLFTAALMVNQALRADLGKG